MQHSISKHTHTHTHTHTNTHSHTHTQTHTHKHSHTFTFTFSRRFGRTKERTVKLQAIETYCNNKYYFTEKKGRNVTAVSAS